MVREGYSDLKEYVENLYAPRKVASTYNAALLELQRLEAVRLFDVYIEKLRSDPGPKKYLVELYKLLIKPIEIADNLVDGEPLIFIPHEALSFVPYAALLSKDRKHLIEDHPVGVAHSLRTLGWATKQFTFLNTRRSESDKSRMLLIADPFPLGESKVSLEDSVEEVKKVATMLPQDYSPKVLVREDASMDTAILHMKTTSWYHIACHGEVTAEYPQGVLFLGAKPDINQGAKRSSEVSEQRRRGFLTPEIIIKDLGSVSTARAAVLSACKVALGKKTGEGLLGLSRAFMQAGVPLVLAPLRTVDSRKCSAFMQHFYKKLVEGESLMFALRSTMVDVIHKRVQVVAARHEEQEEDNDDEEDEEEEEEIKWQVRDWAAWLAVGFSGVCLTSLATPSVRYAQHSEAKLLIGNEDRPLTGTVDFSKNYINQNSDENPLSSASDLFHGGGRDNSSLGCSPRTGVLQVPREDDSLDDDNDDGVLAGPSSISGADPGTPKGGAILSERVPSREDQLQERRAEIDALKGTTAQLGYALEACKRNCGQLNHKHRRALAELDRVRKEKFALEAEIVTLQEQIVKKALANVRDRTVVVAREIVELEQKIVEFEQTEAKHQNEKTKLSDDVALYRGILDGETKTYKAVISEKNARIEELVGKLAKVEVESSTQKNAEINGKFHRPRS